MSEEVSWIFKLQDVISWGEHYHPYQDKKGGGSKIL